MTAVKVKANGHKPSDKKVEKDVQKKRDAYGKTVDTLFIHFWPTFVSSLFFFYFC